MATVRDSAGVQIVESPMPTWTSATAWRADTTPIFDVGGSESDTTRQFHTISGVYRMSDGSVAVVDAGSESIRYFDAKGAPIGRVGRHGDGPGEFPRPIRNTFSCGGDTIYLNFTARVSAYVRPGRHVRDFDFTPPTGLRYSGEHICHGSGIVAGSSYAAWATSSGQHPDSLVLARYDLAGRPLSVIDSFVGRDRLFSEATSGEGRGYWASPYGRKLQTALYDGWVATGRGDVFEIEVRDSTNHLRRIVRPAIVPRPLNEAELTRFGDFLRSKARLTSEPGTIDALMSKKTLPATIPAHADIRYDATGHLWVREYDFSDAVWFWDLDFRGPNNAIHTTKMESRRWIVFDPEGRWLGDAILPPRFDIHQIGSDWILGVWRDDLDVEHARIYRLVKP